MLGDIEFVEILGIFILFWSVCVYVCSLGLVGRGMLVP